MFMANLSEITEYRAEYSLTFAVRCRIHCLAMKIGMTQ
ncbi:unnamed protein product [uncultured virus]|nr:unnamed protein product [uncultured virus]